MAVFVVAPLACQMRLRGAGVCSRESGWGPVPSLQRRRGGATNSSTAQGRTVWWQGGEDGPCGVSLGRGEVGVASMLGGGRGDTQGYRLEFGP